MFASAANVAELIDNFQIEGTTFRYSSFVPRLYNYVKSLGFEPGTILPSRAFCSDENQGYPTIVLAKHFGAFPFNHGRGGGVIATDRHGPFAEHGENLVIIQASHVGYDTKSGAYGRYNRVHTRDSVYTACCGKLAAAVDWYIDQYRIAQSDILLERYNDVPCLRIDNGLLRGVRKEGLFLDMQRLVRPDYEGKITPLHTHSTSKSFIASTALAEELDDVFTDIGPGQRVPIGKRLRPEMFYFRRELDETIESRNHTEVQLMYPMPWIVTSPYPLLTAAQINTQVEFDRTLRTIAHAHSFLGKQVFFIAGLNIDISPKPDEPFPMTKFVPWAAFQSDGKGNQRILEQAELVKLLREQSSENPDQIDMDEAILGMARSESVEIIAPGAA